MEILGMGLGLLLLIIIATALVQSANQEAEIRKALRKDKNEQTQK